MNKKAVAREWIVFLVCFVVGLALVPPIIYALSLKFGSVPNDIGIFDVYVELLIKEMRFSVIGIGFYLFVLFIRSVVWGIKSMSSKEQP